MLGRRAMTNSIKLRNIKSKASEFVFFPNKETTLHQERGKYGSRDWKAALGPMRSKRVRSRMHTPRSRLQRSSHFRVPGR